MRRARLVSLGALVGLLAAAPARADVVIAEVERPTRVSAYARHIAFSAWDAQAQVYRLMLSSKGQPAVPLPVPPRSVPFDVDVGPGLGGGVDAVFSRCRREPLPNRPGSPLPAWNTAAGCDVHRIHLGTGTHKPVAGVSTEQASEYLPTIWRDEIAFARRYERRSGSRGAYPYLYRRSIVAQERSQRLPGGDRGISREPGRTGQPVALDMRRGRVAFTWTLERGEGPLSVLRSATVFGRRAVLDRISLLRAGELLTPTQATKSSVVSGIRGVGATPPQPRRYAFPSGRVLEFAALAPGRELVSLSRDNSISRPAATYAVECTGGQRCQVLRLRPDPFE